jgi:hypothetical protein
MRDVRNLWFYQETLFIVVERSKETPQKEILNLFNANYVLGQMSSNIAFNNTFGNDRFLELSIGLCVIRNTACLCCFDNRTFYTSADNLYYCSKFGQFSTNLDKRRQHIILINVDYTTYDDFGYQNSA